MANDIHAGVLTIGDTSGVESVPKTPSTALGSLYSNTLLLHADPGAVYRGSAKTYTALAPLAVSASGVTLVWVAAIGPPPAVMAMY